MLLIMIFVHNMLVQTICLCNCFTKAHRHPPHPPLRRKTVGESSPLSGGGGEKPSGRWILWEWKKIGARLSPFHPPDPSAIPMSAAASPPQRKLGRQVKLSHVYLYSALNNTNCNKATAKYKNRKIVSIM